MKKHNNRGLTLLGINREIVAHSHYQWGKYYFVQGPNLVEPLNSGGKSSLSRPISEKYYVYPRIY